MPGWFRWLVVVGGVLGVIGAGLLIGPLAGVTTPPDVWNAVPIGELDLSEPWVRVEGTAHYDSMITQTVPAGLFSDGGTWYLFAFFPVNDTGGREIPLLVRTQRAPDRLVAFETMTIEGRLLPLAKDKVPPQTETILSKRTEYFFSDDVLLLVPLSIRSEDEVYQEPR